jgi:PEP-CTERM motif
MLDLEVNGKVQDALESTRQTYMSLPQYKECKMLKPMLLGLGAASLLVVMTAMPVQAAHINLPPPDPSDIVNVLGTDGISYQWVWASPCPGYQPNCDSEGDLIDDNNDNGFPDAGDGSIHGFTYASADQWNASFTSLIALENAFTFVDPVNGLFDPVSGMKISTLCAAASFVHDPLNGTCNLNEIRFGNIWNSPLRTTSDLPSTPDTFLVSVSGSPVPGSVPEPSSLLLLGAGLLGLAAWRWKHAA